MMMAMLNKIYLMHQKIMFHLQKLKLTVQKGQFLHLLSFSTASEQSLDSDNVVLPWEEEARPELEESATDICPVTA